MRRWPLAALLFLVACQPEALTDVGIRSVKTPNPNATATPKGGAATLDPVPRSPLPAATATPVPTPQASPSPSPTPTPRLTPTPQTPAASPVLNLTVGGQAADTWQTGPSLQRARSGLVAAAADGLLLAAEGENRPSLETLAAGGSGWTLVVPPDAVPGTEAPIGRRLAFLGSDGHRVIAAGGDNSDVTDDVVSYGKDGPVLAARLPVPLAAAAGGIVGDYLISIGGLDKDRHVTADVHALDLQKQTAALGTAMPQGVAGAAYAVLGNKIYVMGGYTLDANGNAISQTGVQVFDGLANTWQRDGDNSAGAPPPLTVARHSAAACALNGKIYLVGGAGAGAGLLSNVSIYDPAKNTWSEGAPMPTPRALLAVAAFDGRVWALGGRGAGGSTLASVEVYQP